MKTMINRICEQCDAPFQVTPSQVNYGKGRFCSPSCARKFQRWKGGRHIDDHGYVRIYTGNGRYAREHRIVMEQAIGRKLLRYEAVHHKNGDKTDNQIENLELMTRGDHQRHHNYEREYHKLDRWSRSYPCCVVCGTTNAKHHCKGRCKPCHDKHMRNT